MAQFGQGRPNPRQYFNGFLTDTGLPGGNSNAIGDYSTAAQDFKLTAGQRELFLAGITVLVRDNNGFTAEKYGGMNALTNGVRLLTLDPSGDIVADWFAGESVKSNADWFIFTNNVVVSDYGSGDNFLSASGNVSDPVARPVYLPKGWSLAMRLNDDFTSLLKHTFYVFGRYHKLYG